MQQKIVKLIYSCMSQKFREIHFNKSISRFFFFFLWMNFITKNFFLNFRTSTKSSDDLPSMTRNTNYFTPKSTIFSKSTIIEEFVVTENILNNLVESIDVKSGSKNNNNDDDEKSATFRQASFFPSNKNNPSNPLRLNWILMIILITASLIIHWIWL